MYPERRSEACDQKPGFFKKPGFSRLPDAELKLPKVQRIGTFPLGGNPAHSANNQPAAQARVHGAVVRMNPLRSGLVAQRV